jgi:hypothetical protein
MWVHKWEEEKNKNKLRKMAESFGRNKTRVRAIKSQLAIRKGAQSVRSDNVSTTTHFTTFRRTLNLMFTRYAKLKSKILIP